MKTYNTITESTSDSIASVKFSTYDGVSSGLERHVYLSGINTRYEQITPNSGGSHHEWKNFEHYKRSCSGSSEMGSIVLTTDTWSPGTDGRMAFGEVDNPSCCYNGVYGGLGDLSLGLPSFYVPRSDGGMVSPPDNLTALQASSMRAMLPYVKPELSLPNSIYELKDFKSLPTQIRNIKNLLQGVPGSIGLPARVLWWLARCPKGKTLAAYLRESAGAYLQYKFNISPLLSDISDIYRAVSRVEKRLNALITRAGAVRTTHWCCSLKEYENPPAEESSVSGLGLGNHGNWSSDFNVTGSQSSRRQVFYAPSEFHATLQYNFSYADYQAKHASLLATLDYLGVNLNPAIIWNAIPWSFVVDWVFGISRMLNDFRMGWMDPAVHIYRYCWSIKRSRTIIVDVKASMSRGYYGVPLNPPQYVTLPPVTETAYARHVCWPAMTDIKVSGLSSVELGLATALAVSRRGKRRK